MMRLIRRIARIVRKRTPKGDGKQKLNVGEGTRISRANLDGMFPHLVHVGKNCVFAPTAMILAHDASYYLFSGEYRVAQVILGDNVFVGYGAIIMPGIRIGSNVVVGAGTIVTKDVPDDSVVIGVPGQVVGSITDYLDKRKLDQMFVPPYQGKRPNQVNPDDVSDFRTVVYRKIGLEALKPLDSQA